MFIIQVNEDNIPKDIVHVGTDRAEAEKWFFRACQKFVPNWEGESGKFVSDVLDDGYVQFGNSAIVFIDTDGFTSDAEILGNSPARDVQNITRWVQSGEIGEVDTVDEVMDHAESCLDASSAWDICGPVLFQTEDNKWYSLTTEAVIVEANPLYVKDVLENQDEDA